MNLYSTRRSTLAILTACTLSLGTSTLYAQGYKHVAVAPDALESQQLPTAEQLGTFSHSTMAPIDTLGSQPLRIDTREETPIVLVGPDAATVNARLLDPDGKVQLDERSQRPLPTRDVTLGQTRLPGKDLPTVAEKPGTWQLELSAGDGQTRDLSRRHYALVKGDPNFKLYSYRTNTSTLLDSEVVLVAHMLDATDARQQRGGERRQALLKSRPVQASIESADVTLTWPSGSSRTLRLNDEGRDGDAVANDGRFSVRLPTDELGTYTQELQVLGTRPDGLPFSRTTMDLYPVIAQDFRLADDAAELVQQGQDSFLNIPVHASGKGERVFVAAELWGSDRRGRAQPLSWVGGMVDNGDEGQTSLQLALDSRWLDGAQAPFSVRNVRLQHADNHTPMDSRSALRAQLRVAPVNARLQASSADTPKHFRTVGSRHPAPGAPVTMDAGITPAAISPSAAGGVLMLVHGYCSSSAWDTGHFSNAVEFKDYKANRSHDAFARKIRDTGASYPSFGVVAHSQGGAAALHLYAKYVSGLDYASGGRLIQSVGTPYQGTSLAGNLAVLGQVFGAGCGKNTDLTYSGAANWLATIPGWARAEVDYYTTSFNDRWWAYDYCHLATDLLLDDPDDGTTEKWAGQLSGAVNKGHKSGWCHTSGMRDPAQTRDTSRNSSMSSRAAR